MRSLKILSASFSFFLFILVAPYSNAQEYVLGEGDLLKITVYENNDLTTEARISGDGKISFPLVGSLNLTGITVSQAEKKLTALLADGFLVDPHVTIFVSEYRSKKVTILGEVKKPGLYELSADVTILEIISKAEGLTEQAGDEVMIKHRSAVKGVEGDNVSINLKSLNQGGEASNIMVQDGDRIYVTKSGFVYVTGEVKKPGAYKYEQGMTVMKAIALAEGLTDKAAPGRTKLIRKIGGGESTFKVDMGTQVQPDDVVSVPESFF